MNLEPLSVCQFEKTLLCTGTPFVNGCRIRKFVKALGLCVDSWFMCGHYTGSVLTNQICVGTVPEV